MRIIHHCIRQELHPRCRCVRTASLNDERLFAGMCFDGEGVAPALMALGIPQDCLE